MPKPDMLLGPVTDRSAWKGADMTKDDSWIYRLNAREAAEIESAFARASSTGKRHDDITPRDFPLEAFGRLVKAMRDQIEDGRGVTLLKGLPIGGKTVEQVELLYAGISVAHRDVGGPGHGRHPHRSRRRPRQQLPGHQGPGHQHERAADASLRLGGYSLAAVRASGEDRRQEHAGELDGDLQRDPPATRRVPRAALQRVSGTTSAGMDPRSGTATSRPIGCRSTRITAGS